MLVRTMIAVLAACLLALPLAACGDSADKTAEAACACDKGKAGETVWCEECAAGYVGGAKTTCKDCYAAKQGGPACKACAAKQAGGEVACVCDAGKKGETVWCEKCAAGYVDGNKTTCKDCFTAKQGGPACKT